MNTGSRELTLCRSQALSHWHDPLTRLPACRPGLPVDESLVRGPELRALTRNGNKLTIGFDHAGRKRVVDSFVERT